MQLRQQAASQALVMATAADCNFVVEICLRRDHGGLPSDPWRLGN